MSAENVVTLPSELERRYAQLRRHLDEADGAQAQAQACASRGLDLYLAACRECAEIAKQGQTQQQIAQGIGRPQSMVAWMTAIANDARIIGNANNSLPTDLKMLYLLTCVPDADFERCCSMSRSQLEAHVVALPTTPRDEAAPRTVGRPKGSKTARPPGQWAILEKHKLINACTSGVQRRKVQAEVGAVAELDPLPRRPTMELAARIDAAAAIVADQYNRLTAEEVTRAARAMIPETQQARFDRLLARAIAAHVEDMRKEQNALIAAEVERRLSTVERERIEAAVSRAKSAEALERIWRGRMQHGRTALREMAGAWRLLAACLHPDRAPPDRADQYGRAMHALNGIKVAIDALDLDQWGGDVPAPAQHDR